MPAALRLRSILAVKFRSDSSRCAVSCASKRASGKNVVWNHGMLITGITRLFKRVVVNFSPWAYREYCPLSNSVVCSKGSNAWRDEAIGDQSLLKKVRGGSGTFFLGAKAG